MSAKFSIGDRVFVPSRKLPRPELQPYALTEARVTAQRARTVQIDRVDLAGNNIEVASRLVHRDNLGILILELGDLRTEESTLDPLSKSVLQYMRLLVEGTHVRLFKLRTTHELERIWSDFATVTSHVILIGHGAADSIKFIDRDKPVGGKELARILEAASPTVESKTVISLSCLTGREPFARPMSAARLCSDYIAPFQSVHSAAASLYAQAFFAHHLLNGEGVAASHRKARKAVGRGVLFRRWHNGEMKSTP